MRNAECGARHILKPLAFRSTFRILHPTFRAPLAPPLASLYLAAEQKKEIRLAQIRPFAGIRYDRAKHPEVSKLIAPPYDVLDDAQKAALQGKHPNNVVTVDLPFMPPKSVGPDSVYSQADTTIQSWLSAGVLKKDARAAMYPYMQTYDLGGRTHHRRGFIALVRLTFFGVNVMTDNYTLTDPVPTG